MNKLQGENDVMLGCESYRMRKACGTLLSGYGGTELTVNTLLALYTMPSNNAKDSLRQFISVRPRFFHMVNSFLTQLIRSGIPTHRMSLTVSAMRHSPKFVDRARTRSA
jgi:hypothetical protein